MHGRRLLAALAGAALLALEGVQAQDSSPRALALPARVQFNRDVRPILAENCFKCHGQDAKARKGDLRLDTREGALGKRPDAPPAVIPGKPAESELYKRISAADPDDLMPPAKSNKKLSAREKEILKRWIEQGAEYQGHWSFAPLQAPALPKTANRKWAREPLDSFILARLEEEGLAPSTEADRPTLARRLTLDLTGLPPTPAEVDDFVADRSPDAWERLVDRLLASPRYGEHFARFWMDLARYGDTHGLHLDNYREMWPFRDWVINAFNANLPFDRFVTEQVAGDLIPDATLDQQVASGFNRCHVTTSEGGSIEEEVYCRNVFDRVETFSQVYLAVTFTCTRCHDHKFDPWTQKDYYGLFAYFNSLDGSELDGNKKDPEPILRVPAGEDRAALAAVAPALKALEERMKAPLPEVDAAQSAWETGLSEKLRAQWAALRTDAYSSTGGSTLRKLDDGSILAGGHAPDKDAYELVLRTPAAQVQAIRLEVFADPSLPNKGAGRADNSNFVLSEFDAEAVSVADPSKKQKVEFAAAQADYEQKDFGVAKAVDNKADTGWAIDGKPENRTALFFPKSPFGWEGGTELRVAMRFNFGTRHAFGRFRLSVATDADLLRASMPVTLGKWSSIGPWKAATAQEAFKTAFPPEIEIDLKKKYGDGKLAWENRPRWEDGVAHMDLTGEMCATYLTRTIDAPTAREITLSLGSDDTISLWANGKQLLANEAYRAVAPDQDKVVVPLKAGENRILMKICNGGGGYGFYFKMIAEQLGGYPAKVVQAVDAPAAKRNEEQKTLLREYYRREHWPGWKALDDERAALREKQRQITDRSPTTLVFREKAQPKDSFILKRGEYDKRGDKVARATPAALPQPAKDLPVNRLGLAKWLLDPGHPLTARVAVNRFWQQFFGTGLVKTSEDFGLQGQSPSHFELLDHLAAQFIADGWDVKKFMRRIAMSATYRQSSKITPELLRRDPENRLLARGPRFRLDAEMLRDQALFLSGLLVEKVGGPSFKPPQPEGLWEAVGYTGSNTYRFQRDAEPQKVFRRSMYIFWKRTSAPPMMTLFDAPSREACIARRERTNTPLQALMLMNEPQYVEAARHLAQKAILEGGATPEERVAWMVRRCTLRPAGPKDVADLVAAYKAQRAIFDKDPAAAKKTVAFGDLPAAASADAPELAAWTLVASVLLNLDEVLNKR